MRSRLKLTGAAAVVAALIATTLFAEDRPASAGKVRIGTYDSRAVALAWSRSDTPSAEAWRSHLAQLMRDGRAAKDAGRQEEYAKLEREAVNLQFLAHAIVFSTAPPEAALADVNPRLPAIASQAGVLLVVPRTDWRDPSVEAVDVTDALVAEFKPSPEVTKMLEGFRKQAPVPLQQLTKPQE